MCTVTLGSFFSHCALSTMFAVTAVVKSYAAPSSVHPFSLKPSFFTSFGSCAFSPFFTVCTRGSGAPPLAMKVTVKVATPGFGVHRASSTRSSFTGRVKSYSAPRSIHPPKVKSVRVGFSGCISTAPSATMNSIRFFPSANVPPFATKTTVCSVATACFLSHIA